MFTRDAHHRSVDDLEEENSFLRQELFQLCQRIQEAETWRRQQNFQQEHSNQHEIQTEDIEDKLSVLETEMVQLRLTNFELMQKMKEIEASRIHSMDESKRMQREVQRLLPIVSQHTLTQRALNEAMHRNHCLRLAHHACAVHWSKTEEMVNHQQNVISSYLQRCKELETLLQQMQAQVFEKTRTIQDRNAQLEEITELAEMLQDELRLNKHDRETLLSQYHHSQSRCITQAKELERLKTRMYDIQVITPTIDMSPPPVHTPVCAPGQLQSHSAQQRRPQEHCSFFCVPL